MNTHIIVTTDTNGDLLMTLKSSEREVFTDAIQGLKENVAACFRSYDSDTKQWRITDGGRESFDNWVHFMQVCHSPSFEYAKAKTKGAPPRSPPAPSRAELYATLYLLPDAPQIVVKSSYRALAQLHHPDAGGTHEAMLKINKAYERLRFAA